MNRLPDNLNDLPNEESSGLENVIGSILKAHVERKGVEAAADSAAKILAAKDRNLLNDENAHELSEFLKDNVESAYDAARAAVAKGLPFMKAFLNRMEQLGEIWAKNLLNRESAFSRN